MSVVDSISAYIPKRGKSVEERIRAIAAEISSIEALEREVRLPGIAGRLAKLKVQADALQEEQNRLCRYPRLNAKPILWTNALRTAIEMFIDMLAADLSLLPQYEKRYRELKKDQAELKEMFGDTKEP